MTTTLKGPDTCKRPYGRNLRKVMNPFCPATANCPMESKSESAAIMTDPLASKSGQIAPKLRIDEERKLVFIPGQDEPKELLPPIVQRTDKETGLPYQHIVTASEILEAKEQHEALHAIHPGCPQSLVALYAMPEDSAWNPTPHIGERAGTAWRDAEPGGHRVDWDSIVEHLESTCSARIRNAMRRAW